MRNKISQNELDGKIKAHNQWLGSNRTQGKTFTASNLDFTSLNFENANLSGANLVRCCFVNARMRGCNAESCNFSESDFSGTDLSFSTLKRSDCRHVKINKYTNFMGSDATEMLIDAYNFALMPDDMKTTLQVFDANSIFVEFKYEDATQKFVAEEIINTFDEVIRNRYDKNKDVKTEFKNEYGKFTYIINTNNEEDRQAIEEDKANFALVLQNKMSVQDYTEDIFEQNFIQWRIQRLVSDFQMVSRLEEQQRMHLAKANNEIIILKEEITSHERLKNILLDSIEALKQGATSLLAIPKTIFRAERSEDDYEDIDSDEILYIEKPKDLEDLFLRTENQYFYIKNTISDVEDQLLRNPNFIIGNKGLLVNVKKVKKQENNGNNIIAHFGEGSNRISITISQTRKDKFKELYKELHKKK